MKTCSIKTLIFVLIILMMKKILLVSVLIFVSYTIKAQDSTKHYAHMAFGGSVGNYVGYCGSVNYIYDNKVSLQIALSNQKRFIDTFPSEFNAFIRLKTYELMVGKVFELNKTKSARLNLQIGAANSIFASTVNWKKIKNPPLFFHQKIYV